MGGFPGLRARAHGLLALMVCVIAGGAGAQPATLVGTLPGAWSVAPSGAAIYRFAITVPPGVAGMEPQLELAYNSQSGNGLAGIGWGLSGFSAISRCPRTQAHDGVRGAVRGDLDDRYCLDGQRLMLASGSWGGSGASYATELESFSQVVSVDAAGAGPRSFVVRTKAGLTMEYGGTADARLTAPSSATVLTWAVSAVRDARGNEIAFDYATEPQTGEQVPLRVRYGGNPSLGHPHMLQLAFIHEQRPDVEVAWRAGTLQRTSQRLARIELWHQGTLVRQWRLQYETSPTSRRSRLLSLQLCSAGGECLAPTTFRWSDARIDAAAVRVDPDPARIGKSHAGWQPIAGDFNGDGRTDLLWDAKLPPSADGFRSAGERSLWIGTGLQGEFIESRNLANADGTLTGYEAHIGDFNADGKADFFWDSKRPPWQGSGHSEGVHMLWLSGPGGLQVVRPGYETGQVRGCEPLVADFDGDGRSDIFWDCKRESTSNNSNGVHLLWMTQPDGSFRTIADIGTRGAMSGWQPHAGDFNGDGKADILWDLKLDAARGINRSAGRRVLWIGKGDGTFDVIANAATFDGAYTGFEPLVLDLNGDGLADVFWDEKLEGPSGSNRSAGRRSIWFSRGDGSFEVLDNVAGQDGQLAGHEATFGDFNGDGRVDVLWDDKMAPPASTRSTGRRTLWLSLGGGRYEVIGNPWGHDGQFVGATPLLGDWFGHGRTDILWDSRLEAVGNGRSPIQPFLAYADGHRSAGDHWLVTNTDPGGDLLTQVQDAHGATETFFHAPLTSGVHAQGGGERAAPMAAGASAPSGTGLSERLSSLAAAVTQSAPADAAASMAAAFSLDYPRVDIQPPIPVVIAVASGYPGAELGTDYRWGGLQAEAGTGRGVLGFRWMMATARETGIETYTEFRQGHPYTGQVSRSETRLAGSGRQGLLKRSTRSFAQLPGSAPGSVFAYLSRSVDEAWDLSGTELPGVTTDYVYGQAPQQGDPTVVTVRDADGYQQVTRNEYAPPNIANGNWILGRVIRSAVTRTAP